MSNFLSTHLKNIAFITNERLDYVSIKNLESEIESIASIDVSALSYEKNIELYKFLIKILNNIETVEEYNAKLQEIINKIESKFEYINKRIRVSLYEKVKSARLVNDYTIQKQSLAFDVDIDEQSFKTMTGSIIDKKILAIKSKNNGIQKLIDTSLVKSVKVEGNNGQFSVGGAILKKALNGWVVANKEEVIGNEGVYLAKTQSTFDGENEITISINLGRITSVEAITPVFVDPEVIKIYTSKNDQDYDLVVYKTSTKNKTFILDDKNIKNIKIVINKKSPSYKLGNTYLYESKIKQIKISTDYEKEEVLFETKNININKTLSKISISTIDNYESEDTDIRYYINIDEKGYEEIRPTGKIKNKEISSVIDIENETENKLINLKNAENINGKFLYTLEIPQPFVITNNTHIFNNLNNWIYTEGVHKAYIFNYEEKEINIGNKFIYINGKKETGILKIKKGINKIEIPEEFFINLFNKKLCKKYTINGSAITITFNNDTTAIITDTMYPYNVKLLIDENSDFLFQKLTETKDFNFKLTETNNLQIETLTSNDELYCVYNSLYKNTGSIRIKGTLKSTNNKTIPRIEKIIVRAE